MIIHGTAYIDGEFERRYIVIEGEKIKSIKKSYDGPEEVLEYDGVILPAGIDLHVHFREPGDTEKEDFFTGTKSAAMGGITTVMDMPNNRPPIETRELLDNKIEIASEKSCIDFGLYGLLGGETEKMLERTKFFKVYMSGTTGIEKSEFKDEIETVYENGGKVAFHCEDDEEFGPPADDLKGYNEHRPPESEESAIEKLSKYPEGPKRVCHISSEKGLNAARDSYTTEVTPHHLFMSEEALLEGFGKVNPPLRSQGDQFSLWEAFERDEIDILASDHAPHLDEEKKDFKDAPPGIPGVQTMYPLLLNSANMGDISVSTVIETIAENPADYLGLKKGYIKEGYDADLIITSFQAVEKIERKNLHHKVGWSPFEGFNAIFPRHVISRGEFVVKDREFVGDKGRGKYISG